MSLTKHIELLCHEVTEEKDGEKLLALVEQLNRELQICRKMLKVKALTNLEFGSWRTKETRRGLKKPALDFADLGTTPPG